MRRMSIFILGVLALLATPSLAVKGIGFGVQGGYVSGYDNPNLAVYSGAIDKLPMLGVHVDFGFIPVIDVKAAAEYAWKSEKDFFPGVDLTYGDFSVNGTVTYPFPLTVIKPYIGLGIGFHRLLYTWDGTYTGPGALADDQTKMSWHGVGGVSLGFPALPVTFFVEARYTSLQTDPDNTNYTSILGGVTFGL